MKRAEIARMIERAEIAGANYYTPLLRRVMQGEMNACAPMRDTMMPPLYRLGKTGRPVVVIIGDDDYRPAGPDTWTCAPKLREWAAFAIVHGTGGQPHHYEMAAEMAMQVRRLLLVETTSDAAQDWAAFLQERSPALPFMGILPPQGAHPVMPARGGLH